jgi:hypothetical protein
LARASECVQVRPSVLSTLRDGHPSFDPNESI